MTKDLETAQRLIRSISLIIENLSKREYVKSTMETITEKEKLLRSHSQSLNYRAITVVQHCPLKAKPQSGHNVRMKRLYCRRLVCVCVLVKEK